jgi:hypothetical protein
MIALLLASFALAGDLVVEARVPVELYVDGHPVAKLFQPGVLRTPLPSGEVEVGLFVDGRLEKRRVVLAEADAVIVAGRTGLSWPEDSLAVPAGGGAAPEAVGGTVSLRSVADEDIVVQLSRERHHLPVGGELSVEVPAGTHRMSVRSGDGTVIWANGTLSVFAAGAIVQVSDGRMPEVLGGGVFTPDGG